MATKAFHLGKAGDAWFHEAAQAVGLGDPPKFEIVFDHVRAGPDDAHLAFEDVDELG